MQITEHRMGAHLFPNTNNLSHPKRRHLVPILRLAFLSLADAFGCRIEVYSNTALGKPQYNNQPPRQIYSCTPGSSSTQYEVHVLSVYEVVNTRPPSAGNAAVNIVSDGQSGRAIVLVFVSYHPVNWILNLPAGVTISKVILVSIGENLSLQIICDVINQRHKTASSCYSC